MKIRIAVTLVVLGLLGIYMIYSSWDEWNFNLHIWKMWKKKYCQLKSWKMLLENSSIHCLLARCSSDFNRSIVVAWRIYTSFECSWTYCAKTLKLWLSLIVTFKFGHNSSMSSPLNIFVNSIDNLFDHNVSDNNCCQYNFLYFW